MGDRKCPQVQIVRKTLPAHLHGESSRKLYRNPGFNVAHLKPVWDVLDGELQAQIGRLRCGRRVLPQSVKALTFLAEWFSSGAGAYIFLLDIFPGVAVRIVVMDFGFG